LWVEVDNKHALPTLSEPGSKIERGRGFGNSAFLVGDSDNARPKGSAIHSVFYGFFGDSIFPANAGGGERARFYPADNRIDMNIEEFRSFFC
jgi:hypothetical protein